MFRDALNVVVPLGRIHVSNEFSVEIERMISAFQRKAEVVHREKTLPGAPNRTCTARRQFGASRRVHVRACSYARRSRGRLETR